MNFGDERFLFLNLHAETSNKNGIVYGLIFMTHKRKEKVVW